MANYKSNEPCICCGLDAPDMVAYHHEKSQKAFPEHKEKIWNKIPLCLIEHNMCHNKGTYFVAEKYPNLKRWLLDNGWYVCILMKRWEHDNA